MNKRLQRGWRSVLATLSALAFCTLGSCYSLGTVTLTASNTGAPVLLGNLDRMAASPGGGSSSSARSEGELFTATQKKKATLTVGSAAGDQESRTSTNYTDVIVASKLAGVEDANIWVHSVEIGYTAAYYVVGVIEIDKIVFEGWVQEAGSTRNE